jgi:hypothetical protein
MSANRRPFTIVGDAEDQKSSLEWIDLVALSLESSHQRCTAILRQLRNANWITRWALGSRLYLQSLDIFGNLAAASRTLSSQIDSAVNRIEDSDTSSEEADETNRRLIEAAVHYYNRKIEILHVWRCKHPVRVTLARLPVSDDFPQEINW